MVIILKFGGSTKRARLLSLSNSRTRALISKMQEEQETSKLGTPTVDGSRSSGMRVRTL